MDEIPDCVKNLPFKTVRYCVQDKLADLLDPETGNNWRHLACEACELSLDIITAIEAKRLCGQKPTMEVFRYWSQSHPNATLRDFIRICHKLVRNDLVLVIINAYKAGELFQSQRSCFRGGEEDSCSFPSSNSSSEVNVTTPDVSFSISVHPSMEPNVYISGRQPTHSTQDHSQLGDPGLQDRGNASPKRNTQNTVIRQYSDQSQTCPWGEGQQFAQLPTSPSGRCESHLYAPPPVRQSERYEYNQVFYPVNSNDDNHQTQSAHNEVRARYSQREVVNPNDRRQECVEMRDLTQCTSALQLHSRQNAVQSGQYNMQRTSQSAVCPIALSSCDEPRTLLSIEPPFHEYTSRCTTSCRQFNDRQAPVGAQTEGKASSCNSSPQIERRERSPSTGSSTSSQSAPSELMHQHQGGHPKNLTRSISDSICDESSLAESQASLLQRGTWPRDRPPPQGVHSHHTSEMPDDRYRDPPEQRSQHVQNRHNVPANRAVQRQPPSPMCDQRSRHPVSCYNNVPSQLQPDGLHSVAVPRGVARANTKVFLTYSSDQINSKNGVRNLLENLTLNGFDVKLDMKRKEFPKVTEDRVGWLNHQFQTCDFILVCCSAAYEVEAKMEVVPTNVNDHSLNTRYITTLMHTEYREQGSRYYRIIPVVMPGYTDRCVPLWLRNTIIYHWPQDFQPLMGRLTHSHRLPPPPQRVGPGPKIVQVIH
ncbi:uncharacterized protein LOC144448324 [Glandiceps talaboti]